MKLNILFKFRCTLNFVENLNFIIVLDLKILTKAFLSEVKTSKWPFPGANDNYCVWQLSYKYLTYLFYLNSKRYNFCLPKLINEIYAWTFFKFSFRVKKQFILSISDEESICFSDYLFFLRYSTWTPFWIGSQSLEWYYFSQYDVSIHVINVNKACINHWRWCSGSFNRPFYCLHD